MRNLAPLLLMSLSLPACSPDNQRKNTETTQDTSSSGDDDGSGDDGGTGGPTDADGDGVPSTDDCDDANASMPNNDADCDGILTADDCDDDDPTSTTIVTDADCDGILTADDCDDANASIPRDDADCDGILTADDCDDTDATSTTVTQDADCDSILTADDCDDNDPTRYPGAPEGAVGLLEDPACDGGGGTLALADLAFIGENSLEYAGYRVSSAGDVDGDGLDDVLVGAYGNDEGATNAGKAYLLLGSTLTASTSSTIDLSRADFAFIGENEGDYAGVSVSTAGDVDGDGLSDLLVGAPDNDDGGNYAGKVYLVLGSTLTASATTDIDLRQADFAFIGENQGDYAGVSVSSAGDVDGDGLDDVLIGAPYNTDRGVNAGKAYLIFGSTLTASTSSTIDLAYADFAFAGESSNNFGGVSVSTAGDVDGDGLDDLLFGAVGNSDGGQYAGKAYLFLASTVTASASTFIDLGQADFVFVGEASEDGAGYSARNAGDVDGDGLDDVLVGAYGNDDGGSSAGKAYLLLGRSLATSTSSRFNLRQADFAFIGEAANDVAGTSVSTAGDVDGDGLHDLLVGAYANSQYSRNAGKAYLVLGSSVATRTSSTISLSQADFHFYGEQIEDMAGYGVSSAGDVNGDGVDDLLVGALYNDDGGAEAGKAYLILSHL